MLLPIVAMTVMLVVGCTGELLGDKLPIEHSEVMLSLTTRAGEDINASENESVVKTLRLMIFNSEGIQIKNAFYGETSLEGLNTKGGTFTATARLQRDLGQIKVCLIANEPDSWKLGRTDSKVSYAVLSNLTIHYSRDFDFIDNNGNSDDLNLYISPTDHFLMYAETTFYFTAGNTMVAGVLPLYRTAAKVTLTLAYDRLQGVDYDNGEDFVVKSAFIQNQPIYSHLLAGAYENDEFFPAAGKPLVYDLETKVTHPVTFYIPEYYLSAEAFGSELNTFIELLGEYTTAGGLKVPIVYKIPLGEGAQKIVSDGDYIPTIDDYSVVRNHHYAVNGRITKLGKKEGVQAKISILPWKAGADIEVDTHAPYLNVSEIALKQTILAVDRNVSNKVFFWSNQPHEQIALGAVATTFYDQNGLKIDIYALPAMYHPLISVEMIRYAASDSPNSVENNGHIAVNVQLPAVIGWSKFIVAFYVKAGNLKRHITITYSTPISSL